MRKDVATINVTECDITFLRNLHRTVIVKINIDHFLKQYNDILDAESDPLNGLIAKYVQKDFSRTFQRCVIEGSIALKDEVIVEGLSFRAVDFSNVEVVTGSLRFESCVFDEHCVGHERFLRSAATASLAGESFSAEELDKVLEASTSITPPSRRFARPSLFSPAASASEASVFSQPLSKLASDKAFSLAEFGRDPEAEELYSEGWGAPTHVSSKLSPL